MSSTKSLTLANAARLFVSFDRLGELYSAQARTVYKMCASLATERLRLLCPQSDSCDIARLHKTMMAFAKDLRDPVAALERAADKGYLECGPMLGDGLAKHSLRSACKATLGAIAAAREALPGQIEAQADALALLSSISEQEPAPDFKAPKLT